MRKVLALCINVRKLVVVCAEVLGEILLAIILDDYGISETQTEGAVKTLVSQEKGIEEAVAYVEERAA